MGHFSQRLARYSLILGFLAVAGCAATYQNHGYIPPEEDLEQLVVGIDTRATVEDTVGPPVSEALVHDNGYYYVRSRFRTYGIRAPQEIDRQVLAISFDNAGIVQNIERFTLEDGVVVPINRRVTETSVNNNNFLRQLLGNLGRISPAGLGG